MRSARSQGARHAQPTARKASAECKTGVVHILRIAGARVSNARQAPVAGCACGGAHREWQRIQGLDRVVRLSVSARQAVLQRRFALPEMGRLAAKQAARRELGQAVAVMVGTGAKAVFGGLECAVLAPDCQRDDLIHSGTLLARRRAVEDAAGCMPMGPSPKPPLPMFHSTV